MQKKYVFIGIVIFVLLGLVGGLTNKIKKETHEKKLVEAVLAETKSRLEKTTQALNTAKAETASSRRLLRQVARNPDGTVALDGSGNPIFETLDETKATATTTATNSTIAHAIATAGSFTRTDRTTLDKKTKEERPAVRRLAIIYEVGLDGSQRGGLGFNQDLWIAEATVYVTNPTTSLGPLRFGLMARF